MAKLKLSLDELQVESFAASPDDAAGRGTVRGQEDSDESSTYYWPRYTCDWWSCRWTDCASCFNTECPPCEPTPAC